MTTATTTLTTVNRPSEDALIGLDRALSRYEQLLGTAEGGDLATCLRAAQQWLMTVQHEIHLDDVANDR